MLRSLATRVASASARRAVAASAGGTKTARPAAALLSFRSYMAAPALPPVNPDSIDTTGGLKITALKEANPHIDVVRYEHKNRTWTLNHVEFFSEALAIGLLDCAYEPGDVVLSCMPEHWQETMVLQFACSKAGLVMYQLDASLAKSDPDAFKQSIRQGLLISKANILVSPETHDDVNYVNIIEDDDMIPELTIFDTQEGKTFVAPRYPHLRSCIQTGHDDEGMEGWTRLHHMLVDAGTTQEWLRDLPKPGPQTPLLGQFEVDARGIPTGLAKPLTNEQIIAKNVWETYCKILKKEYHQVEGVGVIF